MPTLTRYPPEQTRISDSISPPAPRSHSWRHFLRHFAEMAIVMTVGMVTAVTVFMYGLNLFVERIDWEDVLSRYPVHALIAVAIGMSLPMIPWMRWRGHDRRDAYEMAAVMAVLSVPFICLALFNIVSGAQCGLYCIAGYVAMLGLMIVRRDRYTARSAHP